MELIQTWHNWLICKHINPRAIAPQRQYSELLLLSLDHLHLLGQVYLCTGILLIVDSLCILSNIIDGINRQRHQCDRCQMTLSSNYRLPAHIQTQEEEMKAECYTYNRTEGFHRHLWYRYLLQVLVLE